MFCFRLPETNIKIATVGNKLLATIDDGVISTKFLRSTMPADAILKSTKNFVFTCIFDSVDGNKFGIASSKKLCSSYTTINRRSISKNRVGNILIITSKNIGGRMRSTMTLGLVYLKVSRIRLTGSQQKKKRRIAA